MLFPGQRLRVSKLPLLQSNYPFLTSSCGSGTTLLHLDTDLPAVAAQALCAISPKAITLLSKRLLINCSVSRLQRYHLDSSSLYRPNALQWSLSESKGTRKETCVCLLSPNVEDKATILERHLALASKGKDKSIAIPTDQSQVSRSDELNEDGWVSELRGNIHVFKGSIQEYLDIFVPSRTPIPGRRAPPRNVFSKVPEGVPEDQMYTKLVQGLQKLTQDFPSHVRPHFQNNSRKKIKFPYEELEHNHHQTGPDLIASLPGANAVPRWRDISLVIEVKGKKNQDPVKKNGTVHTRTVIQLAKSARNLLLVHQRLYTIVVGMYGHRARLMRFDHSSAVVSAQFDYTREPGILRQFLWSFVNPISTQCKVVGDDPSLQVPSSADYAWINQMLANHHQHSLTPEAQYNCRWVTFWGPDRRKVRFCRVKLLFVNPRLFSRSTIVWAAFLENDNSGRIFITKDYWRQLARQESDDVFYRYMTDFASLRDPSERSRLLFGIAEFGYAIDLGESEVPARRWQSPSNAQLSSTSTNSTLDFILPRLEEPPLKPVAGTDFHGHCTVSAAVKSPYTAFLNERSQLRILINTAGKPLSEFRRTRRLVEALRDAIIGHQRAYEAGILHRDISDGNVMFNTTVDALSAGFISDFDQAFNWKRFLQLRGWAPTLASWQKFVDGGDQAGIPAHFGLTDQREAENRIQLERDQLSSMFKERTSNCYFVAIEILEERFRAQQPIVHEARHDLESFYWLLLWLVLRHTEHDHPEGVFTCTSVFAAANDHDRSRLKVAWLSKPRGEIRVRGNNPLTVLLAHLRQIFKPNMARSAGEKMPTHESVIAAFSDALALQGWPENDPAKPFQPPIKAPKTLSEAVGPTITADTATGRMVMTPTCNGDQSSTQAYPLSRYISKRILTNSISMSAPRIYGTPTVHDEDVRMESANQYTANKRTAENHEHDHPGPGRIKRAKLLWSSLWDYLP
ncbi:predicted protein [Postia placenta Mad-698-R]|nr:predicted protein [Postia placenta Mad-698-R]